MNPFVEALERAEKLILEKGDENERLLDLLGRAIKWFEFHKHTAEADALRNALDPNYVIRRRRALEGR